MALTNVSCAVSAYQLRVVGGSRVGRLLETLLAHHVLSPTFANESARLFEQVFAIMMATKNPSAYAQSRGTKRLLCFVSL